MVAVFDGHGPHGQQAVADARDLFAKEAVRGFSSAGSQLPAALQRLFGDAQQLLEAEGYAAVSGTTATVAVMNSASGSMTCAHVGDSSLVLARGDGEVEFATVDHDFDAAATARCVARGGEVREFPTVLKTVRRVFAKGSNQPALALARSLGDLEAHAVGVSAEPTLRDRVPIQEGDVLIVASDGVWNTLPQDIAIDIALKDEPEAAAKQLVFEAQRRWPKDDGYVDDITAVIVRSFAGDDAEDSTLSSVNEAPPPPMANGAGPARFEFVPVPLGASHDDIGGCDATGTHGSACDCAAGGCTGATACAGACGGGFGSCSVCVGGCVSRSMQVPIAISPPQKAWRLSFAPPQSMSPPSPPPQQQILQQQAHSPPVPTYRQFQQQPPQQEQQLQWPPKSPPVQKRRSVEERPLPSSPVQQRWPVTATSPGPVLASPTTAPSSPQQAFLQRPVAMPVFSGGVADARSSPSRRPVAPGYYAPAMAPLPEQPRSGMASPLPPQRHASPRAQRPLLPQADARSSPSRRPVAPGYYAPAMAPLPEQPCSGMASPLPPQRHASPRMQRPLLTQAVSGPPPRWSAVSGGGSAAALPSWPAGGSVEHALPQGVKSPSPSQRSFDGQFQRGHERGVRAPCC
eukprot:TRINITY_DN7818_c0_g1_i3.p1 TRINITY_DN7818_c0_g1~~TRINITY_DN7818_c0_g1_i3.p1  ORF type:complete len:696 (-),score=143.33 TRINITY_DN7818_c0_g1_i3:263-2152(-)